MRSLHTFPLLRLALHMQHREADETVADQQDAEASSVGGSKGIRSRKRSASDGESDADESDAPARKLSRGDEMQLRLLASLPSMQGPLRGHGGRRKSVCVPSSEIVDAGLSSLVSQTVAVQAPAHDDKAVPEPGAKPRAARPVDEDDKGPKAAAT